MVNQVIVSAANFFVVILIGRYCGAEDLGTYYLAYSSLIFAIAFQQTLVSKPYTNLGSRYEAEERAVYAGHSLLMQFFLSIVFLLLLAAIGIGIHLLSSSSLGIAFISLALFSPFMLLREFARRYLLTHLRFVQVVVLDSAVAVLQVAGMLLLAVSNNLSVPAAFAAVGLSCSVVGIVWIIQSRRQFPIRLHGLRSAALRNWRFGRWLLASELVVVARGQVIYWMVLAFMGLAATGVLSACMTVVRLANPVMFGIANACEPLLARALASDGITRLRLMIWQITLAASTVIILLCLLIYTFGVQIMNLAFRWSYGEQGSLLALLLAGTAVSTIGLAPAGALNAIGRPDMSFKIRAIGLAATVLLALFMLPAWGLVGGGIAMFVSTAFVGITRWVVCHLKTSSAELQITQVNFSRPLTSGKHLDEVASR